MLDWLLHNASKIAAAIFIVISIVRSIRQARERDATPPPPAGDLEQERREREVREKIRRRIRERQAGLPAEAESSPPVFPEKVEVPSPPIMPRAAASIAETKPVSLAAEMERQQRLADQLRAIEDAKALAARRAAHQAAEQTAAAQTPAALRRGARDELLSDLREPSSLRRAFLVREVIGTPAGLR